MSTPSTTRREARRDALAGGARGWVGRHRRGLVIGLVAVLVVSVAGAVLVPRLLRHEAYDDLYDGKLTAADYWTADPQILSAGLGFVGTVGLRQLDQATVKAAGGAWASTLNCAAGVTPTDRQRTSAVPSSGLETAYVMAPGTTIDHADGLPIVFSWPVLTDTIDPAEFKFTLNTGQVVYPQAAGIVPN